MANKPLIQKHYIDRWRIKSSDLKEEGGCKDVSFTLSARYPDGTQRIENQTRGLSVRGNCTNRLVHVLNKLLVEIAGNAIVSDPRDVNCHIPCAWPETAIEMTRNIERLKMFFDYSFECGPSQGGMA